MPLKFFSTQEGITYFTDDENTCAPLSLAAGSKVCSLVDLLLLNKEDQQSVIQRCKDSAATPLALVLPPPEEFGPPLPVLRRNIFCVGKNFADHAREVVASGPKNVTGAVGAQSPIPTEPILFTKATTALAGPYDVLPIHSEVTDQLDYEGEVVVVIGHQGRRIQRDEAMEYVFGFTLMNDVTARDLQTRHRQYFLGKSLDKSAPLGPFVVPYSEVSHYEDFIIETYVDDELRQKESLRQLVFTVPVLIETISRGMTLLPGDLLALGTPAGVGLGFSPPRFLRKGSTVRITVEEIGSLKNRFV